MENELIVDSNFKGRRFLSEHNCPDLTREGRNLCLGLVRSAKWKEAQDSELITMIDAMDSVTLVALLTPMSYAVSKLKQVPGKDTAHIRVFPKDRSAYLNFYILLKDADRLSKLIAKGLVRRTLTK